MPTKVKELAPHTREHDPRCITCNPPDPKKYVREDQLWGTCPTNGKHAHHLTK